jgi:protein involved in polysaccharide export with SLBB domain
VSVVGEFTYPGTYVINENQDRIRDVIRKAGGTLPGAYDKSFRMKRGGQDVAVDFKQVMKGNEGHDLLLKAGDELHIATNPRTVGVAGAVVNPTLLNYKEGRSIAEYIELSGGPTERGRLNRATIAYPDGTSQRVRRVGLFFHTSPKVLAGSTITVNEKPESKTDVGEMVVRVMSIASTIASLAVAWSVINK